MRSMFAGAGTGPGGFGGGFGGQPGAGAGGFDISDLFGDLFNRGAGGAGGGFGRTQAPRAARGADLETETTLSFADAMDGTTISMRLSSDAPCPTCSGTGGKPGTRPHVCGTCEGAGMVINSVGGGFSMNETCPECHGRQLVYDEACPTCHGSGRGQSNRTISARIPAGVKDGQRIRLKGKGAAGENGGPAGDLLVTVHVRKHQLFGRKGDNLTLEVPVSFDEATLGAEIKVPTLGGPPVTLRVPPGTPNGRVMRVRGRGAPRKDGTKGDLLVTLDVQVPSTLDAATREAVTAYREARKGEDPRARLFLGGS
jgi:molecular chaperone DnaJ